MAPKSEFAWNMVLQIIAVIAAILAVFQQNDGIRIGAGLVAAILVSAGVYGARHAIKSWFQVAGRRGRLTSRQRQVLMEYHEATVEGFMQELPFPELIDESNNLAERIRIKSCYIPVPYHAYSSAFYRMMPRQAISPHPSDPVEMLINLMTSNSSAIVLGDPGSGKTLIAMMTFATLADTYAASRGRSMIPIFVRFNEMSIRGNSSNNRRAIEDLMPAALKDLGPGVLKHILDNGKACIIMDGLDELPATRSIQAGTKTRIPEELVILLGKRIVLTCREAFHALYVDTDGMAARLGAELELLPLTYEGQVVPFTRRYCHTLKEDGLADIALSILSQNSPLFETLSRPLMLRMTINVLSHELEKGNARAAERMLLTGSDFLNAQIYEKYVTLWIVREHRKADHPQLTPPARKIDLVETIAWRIFCNPMRDDTGYGSFELVDLTIDKESLIETIDAWLDKNSSDAASVNRPGVILEIEERTFLIVSEHTGTYRFAHKSFFEYLVARHVYNELAHNQPTPVLIALLSIPIPDEIIDFLRELLHRSRTSEETGLRRRNVEKSLVNILQSADKTEDSLMARQQAANLVPIVATPETREYLREVVASDEHPFIRRGIAVGEALHHQDSGLLDAFIASLDGDERATSFHMGYNRIYYGDQPLSKTSFEDDGNAECSRFFRACIRHMKMERYRYIRTMALATVRIMLLDPARRALLVQNEADSLHWLQDTCSRADPTQGPVYERERIALADQLEAAMRLTAPVSENPSHEVSEHSEGTLQARQDSAHDIAAAGHEHVGDAVEGDLGPV